MKKLFILLLAIIGIVSCNNDSIEVISGQYVASYRDKFSANDYYWSNGKKIEIYKDSNCFQMASIDKLTSVKSIDSIDVDGGYANGISMSNKNGSYLNDVLFYQKTPDEIIGITKEILVELKTIDDLNLLSEIAEEYDLNIIKQYEGLPLWFMLAPKGNNLKNSLEIANQIYELGLFNESLPNMLLPFSKLSVDTYYQEQWGLKNMDYPGIDISYEEATQYIYPGISDVIVAVIDDGVDTAHQDLNIYNITYDAHSGQLGSKLSPGVHGTMVAGVVGAISNNYIGVAGVAPNVEIMPISLRFREDFRPLGQEWSTVDMFVSAINFAVNNGADIINCSFVASAEHAAVKSALSNALYNGRNGKGSIVVLGSGNEDAEITSYYAKNLPEAIVVGGIKKKGEKSDYSSYGQWLDVVAPGDAIRSTAINNQYSTASGTSMAAPFVSGIAALILSKNSTLNRAQVVDIIESTAKKISSYTYGYCSGRAYSWNEKVGYGLVDAYAALNNTPYPPPPSNNDTIPEEDDDVIDSDTLNVQEINGTTITTPSVYSGDIIKCNHIMVYPGGVFILSAEEEIEITAPFTVQTGGAFEFYVQQ